MCVYVWVLGKLRTVGGTLTLTGPISSTYLVNSSQFSFQLIDCLEGHSGLFAFYSKVVVVWEVDSFRLDHQLLIIVWE